MAINILNHFGWLHDIDLECRFGIPDNDFTTGLQACLITIEMFIAAMTHRYVFSYRDFKRVGMDPPLGFVESIHNTFNNADVGRHVERAILSVPKAAGRTASEARSKTVSGVLKIGSATAIGLKGVGGAVTDVACLLVDEGSKTVKSVVGSPRALYDDVRERGPVITDFS